MARMTDKTMVKVLPRMVEEWIGMEDICFITGKIIGKNDRARHSCYILAARLSCFFNRICIILKIDACAPLLDIYVHE